MGVTEELQGLVADHAYELGGLPWAWEADRWTEFVFCLINAHRGALRDEAFTEEDAAASRAIANALSTVGVIGPAELATAGEDDGDAGAVVRSVLGQHGYRPEEAEPLIAILSHVAKTVVSSFDGKIQRLLRTKGEELRDELTELIDADQPAVRRAVAHWLQNVANLPLSVDDDAVRSFCADHACSADDLEQAADEVGVNLALVDDVIRLDIAVRSSEGD